MMIKLWDIFYRTYTTLAILSHVSDFFFNNLVMVSRYLMYQNLVYGYFFIVIRLYHLFPKFQLLFFSISLYSPHDSCAINSTTRLSIQTEDIFYQQVLTKGRIFYQQVLIKQGVHGRF